LRCRTPLAVETTKVTAQEPLASVSGLSSSAAASELSLGIAVCEYTEVRCTASAHRVFQFLDKIKTAADERDGSRLEAVDKALAEDKKGGQATDQELRIVKESNAALNQEPRAAQYFAAAANWELSSKVTALDELSVKEKAAQHALRALAEEKKASETRAEIHLEDVHRTGLFFIRSNIFDGGTRGIVAEEQCA
jgi:hypothetical protein